MAVFPPDKIISEFIPYIQKIINTEEDEVLLAISEELPRFKSYLDGKQMTAVLPLFLSLLGCEETVAREVFEETGLKVKNITYYKSQPWGMAQDILVGYYCEVDGDSDIHMDENELKYAEWVKREDIVLQPNNLSLTNEMMRMFKDGEWSF